MNNLLSYCGLVYVKISASDKDLPVPTVRKNCSSNRENILKLDAEGREFAKVLRSLEQFVLTVKGQKIFGNRMLF